MPKRKFDRGLLDETLARDNARHDDTKELPARLNRNSRIPFTCACGTPHTKVFREIVEKGGARCKLCTERERGLKIQATMLKNHGVAHVSHIKGQTFNRELLDATLARDGAILDETKKLPTRLNRESHIPFKCACGTPHTKVFRGIVEGGGRCEPCTERETRLKTEATMLKNHGVAHISHINGQAFNRELLDATLIRDGAILDETEELPIPLNRESRIPFKCACGTPHTKVFRGIVEKGGARCKLCTERGQVFNRELLDATLARDGAILDETEELPIPLNRESRIPFKCACGTPHTKVFRGIVEGGGARCEPCTERERGLKIQATMLENHGVAHVSHINGQAFNRELLDATLIRDGATLDETKKLPTRLNRESHIPFKCACGTPHTKVFREMEKGGARCEPCTERETRLKIQATMLENHGVAHVSHINGQAFNRELLDATLARDGAILDETEELPIPLNRESRIRFTCACGTPHAKVFREIVEKGGARCELCTERERGLKIQATCLENHGVKHPMQCAEILERAQKNAFKRKDFTTPSGQVWTLQGYEPLVAPKLIDEYGEDDITPDLKQVPRVWWTDSKGVRHKYSCDFYVKSRKLVIEVKGPWTETKDAEKIVATREAANALGYGYRLIVLDGKGVWTRDEFSPSILGAEGKKPVSDIGLENSPLNE